MSHSSARRAARRQGTVVLTALAAITALTTAGCTGPSVGVTDAAADVSADAVDWSQIEPAEEITWWSNHPGESKAVEQELIDEFESETGIGVKLVTAGASYDEVAQRFQAAAQTDDLPDLVIASDVWWFRYHLNDQIMPVDDVMEFLFHESGMATLSADDAMADFSSGLIASTIGSTGSLKGALDTAKFEVGTAYLPDGPQGGGTPTGGTGLAIPSSRSPEEQLTAAMFLTFLTDTENTATFSQSTGYMPVRTSAVESDTMRATYARTPQFRTAVDQLTDRARVQDDVRVFVPGADALLNEAIEQIVIEGTDPTTAFESVTPRIETAYTENVEPYLDGRS